MLSSIPRIYPLLGLCSGYLIVLFFNPVRLALRDGLRCILRFKRIWLTFVLLGLGYSIFQFATFTPLQGMADLDFSQVTAPGSWEWPAFVEIWREVPQWSGYRDGAVAVRSLGRPPTAAKWEDP